METHIDKEEKLERNHENSGSLPLRLTSEVLVVVKVIKIQDAAWDKLSICITTVCACVGTSYLRRVCLSTSPSALQCRGNTAQQMAHL